MGQIGRLSEVEHDHKLRGCAIEIVAQLPKDRDDAERVLEYAKQLVAEFLPGRAEHELRRVSRLTPVA